MKLHEIEVLPKHIAQLYECFRECTKDLVTATKYISPKLTARLSRKRHNKNYNDKRKKKVFVIPTDENRVDFILCVGAPNYLEREFIKQAKKAGMTFPIKKIQLRFIKRK